MRETIGGAEHGRGDTLRVRRAAASEPIALEPRRKVRWDCVEMRGESHSASAAAGPDVRAPARNLLQIHIPPARHEPTRDKIDRAAFSAGRGIDTQQLRRERDDVSHDAKLAAPIRAANTMDAAIVRLAYVPAPLEGGAPSIRRTISDGCR